MRARSEATTASPVEIGWTARPLIGTREGRRSRVRRERSPQRARRDGAQAGAARLRPAPGGAADVQDRVRIGVDLGGMRHDVLERVAEEVERSRALAARHGEHTPAGPERERHGLARPRQRPRHRDDGREQLVAVASRRGSAARGRAARTRAPARGRRPAPPRGDAASRRGRAGSRRCGAPARMPRPRWPRSSRPACHGRRTRRPRSSLARQRTLSDNLTQGLSDNLRSSASRGINPRPEASVSPRPGTPPARAGWATPRRAGVAAGAAGRRRG